MRVLRVLHGVNVPLNASQLAARTRLSQPAVAAVLKELASMGLVKRTPAGRAWVHWLVRDNIYVETMVEAVFSAEWDVPERLIGDLDTAFGKAAESVVLFGSYARGDQDERSDIDVALVAADAEGKAGLEVIAEAEAMRLSRRYGATVSVLVYDRAEAAALAGGAPSLLAEIERDAVVVRGRPPHEWRAHGEER